jgi:hypothetical protein
MERSRVTCPTGVQEAAGSLPEYHQPSKVVWQALALPGEALVLVIDGVVG